MSTDKKYTAQEAAVAVLKKAEEMLLNSGIKGATPKAPEMAKADEKEKVEGNEEMLDSDVANICDKAKYLHELLHQMSESKDTPAWVIEKIAQAKSHIQDVMDYIKGGVDDSAMDKSASPCWDGYKKVPGKKDFDKGSCEPVKKAMPLKKDEKDKKLAQEVKDHSLKVDVAAKIAPNPKEMFSDLRQDSKKMKKSEEILVKANEDRSKMSGKSGMVRLDTESNQNQKGVGQHGHHGSSGGTSEAGAYHRDSTHMKPGTSQHEKATSNVKEIHQNTLSEMKAQPKPSIPGGAPGMAKDEPSSEGSSVGGKGLHKLSKFVGKMEGKKGSPRDTSATVPQTVGRSDKSSIPGQRAKGTNDSLEGFTSDPHKDKSMQSKTLMGQSREGMITREPSKTLPSPKKAHQEKLDSIKAQPKPNLTKSDDEFPHEGPVKAKHGEYFAQKADGGMHHIPNKEHGKSLMGQKVKFGVNEMDDAVLHPSHQAPAMKAGK